jgi:hypothetical protein
MAIKPITKKEKTTTQRKPKLHNKFIKEGKKLQNVENFNT